MAKVNAAQLIKEGATVIKEPTYHPDREKACGRMWGGSTVLKKGDVTYHFDMWYHGGDSMTPEEALDHMSLKGIEKDGKYHDSYWYTIMGKDGSVYLHPKGWFGDNKDLESKLFAEDLRGPKKDAEGAVFKYHQNYNWQEGDDITPEVDEKLRKLGFKKIAGPGVETIPGEPEGTRMEKYMGTEIAVRPGETPRQASIRLESLWHGPDKPRSRRTVREAARKKRKGNSGPSARSIR